jgi:hypothetical protein
MRGVAPSVIQNLAGHSDLSTTQRYMHILEEMVLDAIRRLEAPAPAADLWRHIGKVDSAISRDLKGERREAVGW